MPHPSRIGQFQQGGVGSRGRRVPHFFPVRPSDLLSGNALNNFEIRPPGPNVNLPPLPDMSLRRNDANSEMMLEMGAAFVRRRRRAFGYAGAINLPTSGNGTSSWFHTSGWEGIFALLLLDTNLLRLLSPVYLALRYRQKPHAQ